MDLNLEGRIVLVTGAASGIGKAIAEGFAAEGAALAILDHDKDRLTETADELRSSGTEVSAVPADLSTAHGVDDGINQALELFDGRIDILINNVGKTLARSFDELTDEDWKSTFELNFLSAVRAIRNVLPRMREQRSGSIVSLCSDLARQPEQAQPDYQMSKVGIATITKSLAMSEGPHIRVNAVAPGPIWTSQWTRPGGYAHGLSKLHGLDPKAAVEKELKGRRLPLGRAGTTQEVSDVVAFLASDAASYVTGSIWGIDGGSIRALF